VGDAITLPPPPDTVTLPPPPQESEDVSRINDTDPESSDKIALARQLSKTHGVDPHFTFMNAEGISQALYGVGAKIKEVWQKLGKTNDAAVKYRQRNELASDIAQTGHATPEQIQRLQQFTAAMPDPKETYQGLPRQSLDFLYSMASGGRVGLAAGGAAALTTEVAGQAASAAMGPAAPIGELATQIDTAGAFGSFFATGMASGVAFDMGRQARGQAFADLVTMKDANGKTIDPRIAAQAANGIGTVTTAVMGAMSALGPTMSGIARTSIQKATMSVLLDGSLKRSVLGIVARAGAASGEMSAANVIQESSNLIFERSAKDVNNRVNGTTFTQAQADEVIARLKESALSGAVQGAIFHAPEMLNEGLGLVRATNLREVAKAAGVKESDMGTAPQSVNVPDVQPPAKIPTIAELMDSPEAKLPEESLASGEQTKTKKQLVQLRKWTADLKKIDTSKMHPDIKGPVQDILDQYNLASPSKKTLSAAAEIKSRIDENPDANLEDWEKTLLDRASRKNFRELSFDEAKAVHDSVMYYDKLQRESTKLIIQGRQEDRAKIAEQAIKEIPHPKKVIADNEQTFQNLPNTWDKIKKDAREVVSFFRDHMMGLDFLADTVGGGENSAFYKGVFKNVHEGEGPLAERNGGERGALKMSQQYDDLLKKQMTLLLDKVRNYDDWRAERVAVGKTPKGKTRWNLTHGARVSLYMLWKQEDSRAKLADPNKGGFGSDSMLNPNHVYHLTMDDWYELLSSITPEEKEAARAYGEFFKKAGIDVNAQHVATKNYEMDIENNYFPEDVMPISRGSRKEIEEARQLAKRKYAGTLPKGRTISRQGIIKPLYVRDVHDVYTSHRDWASNYVHTDQPLLNAMKLARDVEANITEKWGPELYKEIENRLKLVLGRGEEDTGFGKMMSHLRARYVASALTLNPISIAANLMNVERSVTSGLLKTGYALNGVMDSTVHPFAVHRELRDHSPLYRAYHVEGGFNVNIQEALSEGNNTFMGRAGKIFRKVLAYPSRLTDRIAVRAIMRGSLFQAMDEIRSGHLSPEMSNALNLTDEKLTDLSLPQKMEYGYRFAEYVLEHVNSVPMSTLESGLHQGSWVEQTMGTFGYDAVRAQQLYRTAIRNAARSPSLKNFRRLGALTVGLFLIEPLHYVLINYARQQVMSGRKPPSPEAFKAAFDFSDQSDEAKQARRYIGYEFLDQASYYFPVIRDFVRPAAAAATGQYAGNSLLITDEYTRLSGRAIRAAAKLARGEGDEKTWTDLMDNGGHLLASMLGVPYTSPKFWIKKVEQIAGGEE
jgi:hypothetical protein